MKLLIGVVFSLLLIIQAASCFAAGDVSLAWDANTESDLAGYKIYYKIGSSGEPYDGIGAMEGNSPVDVGNVTTFTLNGLTEGSVYYLVATAYNTENLESSYSNEVFMQIETETPDTTSPATPTGFGIVKNIALNKGIASSGNEFTLGTEAWVTDGIVDEAGKFWAARGVPNWVIIDLGDTYKIDAIKVNPFGRDANNYWYADAWNVKYATEENPDTFLDFITPTKLSGTGLLIGSGISVTDGDPGHGLADDGYQYYEFAFDPVGVRYVWVEITEGDADGDSNLDEVEIFAANSQ